jgi:ABC-type transporter Mla subunit MlaD
MERATEYLKNEGQNLLQNALNAANRLGDRSQQLSEFAEQSSTLVAKQDEQRAEIEKLAESAAVNSKKALNEANEAIFGASTTSQQIETLQNQVKQTADSFEQIKQIAEQVNNEAKNAHNQGKLIRDLFGFWILSSRLIAFILPLVSSIAAWSFSLDHSLSTLC